MRREREREGYEGKTDYRKKRVKQRKGERREKERRKQENKESTKHHFETTGKMQLYE